MSAWVIVSELLGFLGIAFTVAIYQQKKRKKLLVLKLISNVVWTLHYGVAGNMSGAAVGGIGVVRESVFLSIEDKKRDRRPFLVLFMVCACVMSVLTWRGVFSLLPFAASLTSVLSFWQQKPRLSRLLAIPISLCMLTYDIYVLSIAGIVNEVLTLTSTVIGIVRLDLLAGKKAQIK